MKTITMLDFRQNSESVVNALKRGVSLVLTYRGKNLAVISPYQEKYGDEIKSDPFWQVCESAVECPETDLLTEDEDSLIYK